VKDIKIGICSVTVLSDTRCFT